MKAKILLYASAVLIVIGRLSIPTRHNFSFAGFYEAIAHVWVGAVIMAAITVPRLRTPLATVAFVLSVWELLLVLLD
jgi:hypothetical protein